MSTAIEFLTLLISFLSNLSLSTWEHQNTIDHALKGHDSFLQIRIVSNLK